MPNRECYESIKNSMNDIWLNPKCYIKWAISNQASNRGRLNDYPICLGVEKQAYGFSKW
jgi:hypothetical protein